MGAAAELFVRVTADVKGLTSGMDEAAKAIDNAGKGAAEAVKPVGNLMDIIKGTAAGELLADGIRSAAGAMVELGQKSLNLASELEQNKIAFTTMLGSAEKADTFLRDLASFAASTPFELRGLTDSSKKLLAFGFDAQAVLPIMNSIGNAVAAVGGGKDVLDGVTMALGQMAAKGKVSAEEMNQLAERGIPAWKMLADGIGVSVPEAMKKAEKGSIDANTAIVALVNGMNQKFPDMMSKQSQTFGGAMSNLTDSMDMALTRIGKKMIDAFNLTRVIQATSTAIANLSAAFEEGLIPALDVAFGPTTKAAIIGVGTALTVAFLPAIVASAPAIVAAGVALAGMAAAAAAPIAAGIAIGAAAYVVMRNWDSVRGMWLIAMEAMGNAGTWVRNKIVAAFSDAANFVGKIASWINERIRDAFGVDIAAKLGIGLGKVSSGFSAVGQWATEKLGIVQDAARYAAEDMASNFTYAFNQMSGAAKVNIGNLTKGMTGLAAAPQAAAAGASKAAAATKAHAAEMKKAEAAARKYEAALKATFERYREQEEATGKLGARLAAVMAQEETLGRTFDVAGAKAEAYKDSLSELTKAFGDHSPQVVMAMREIEKYRAASEGGGAATAKAFATIAEAGKDLDTARAKAVALGTSWDETSEALKVAEAAMGSLVEQGLRPGAAAYDEQAAKLKTLRDELSKHPSAIFAVTAAAQDLVGSFKTLASGALAMVEGLGIQIPEVARAAFDGFMSMGSGILSAVMAVQGLTVAWGMFTAAFAANPIGAILVGVTAVTMAVIGGVVAAQEVQRKSTEEAAAALKKAQEEAEAARKAIEGGIASALKSGAKMFIDGAADWADTTRNKIREGLIAGVIDALMAQVVVAKLADLQNAVIEAATKGTADMLREAVSTFADGARNAVASLEPVFDQFRQVTREYLPEIATKVSSDIEATTRAANAKAEAARVSVNESHQASLLRQIERTTDAAARERLLSQLRVLQGRATSADLAAVRPAMGGYSLQPLPGMATGGLVTGPTVARMGEGGRNEAVLPLNENVYRQIGEGIAAARGGGAGMQLVVNYTGNGKWTREDAQGLGRLLVSELRAMGVRA